MAWIEECRDQPRRSRMLWQHGWKIPLPSGNRFKASFVDELQFRAPFSPASKNPISM
jgi:hypothetical protein